MILLHIIIIHFKMKIFKHKSALNKAIKNIQSVSFVPTMGALHKGHISLIKKGKTLVSVYVNPKQFNSKKDFNKYPRNLKKDLATLKKLKVDYTYLPKYSDIFSFKVTNSIYLHKSSKLLCGKFRLGHFKGVLNIVNRFLEIIKPKFIFLGKKDFQQFFLIKKHVEKRKINSKIILCNTIREKNGIACSSRNKNLNFKQIKIASKAINIIKKEKKLLKQSKKKLDYIKIIKRLKNLGVKKIDYIKVLNLKNLKKPKNLKNNFNIFIAFYIGNVRLIDNF